MENEIMIRTSSGEYVGGDTIYGTVYVYIRQKVHSRSLKIVLRGYEQCEYEYSSPVQTDSGAIENRTGRRKGRHDVLKADIKLIDYPGSFPEGCLSFPFQYQLPHNLPGGFHINIDDREDGHLDGVIRYSIGAVLFNPFPKEKLQVDFPLIIYDSPDCRNTSIKPDPHSNSAMVKTFFCLNRGTVTATSRLTKGAYSNTEPVKLSLEIQNGSAVDVSGATVKLMRVLKFYGKDSSQQEEEEVDLTCLDLITSAEFDGCPKNSTKRHNISLEPVSSSRVKLPPSTSGLKVKCRYFVDADVHVPWSPDVEVQQTVLVNPPKNIVWERWEPPEWVLTCGRGPVVGPCAVSRDVLCTSSFSGIPGFQPRL